LTKRRGLATLITERQVKGMVIIGWAASLPKEEREAADRLRQALVAHYLGAGAVIRCGGNGRPELDLIDADISTSHSDGIVAVALCLSDSLSPMITTPCLPGVAIDVFPGEWDRIGLDIECVDKRKCATCLSVAKRWFSPAEQSVLRCLSPQEATVEFCRMWTKKESYLKLTGVGISALQCMDTLAPPDGVRFLTEKREIGGKTLVQSLCLRPKNDKAQS